MLCVVAMYLIDRTGMLHCLNQLATYSTLCVLRIIVLLKVWVLIYTSCELSQYVAHNYAGLYRKDTPSPLRIVLALP